LPKALRASAGSAFRIPLAAGPKLSEIEIEDAVGLDMEGEDLGRYQFAKNSYLILGEEGQGLPPNLKLKRVRIPMAPGIESLNATVAASLALFSYAQQNSSTSP
jgi:TrmH family RNA methyltransferase